MQIRGNLEGYRQTAECAGITTDHILDISCSTEKQAGLKQQVLIPHSDGVYTVGLQEHDTL